MTRKASKHCRKRLEIAARLATSFDAHLTGLYTSAIGDAVPLRTRAREMALGGASRGLFKQMTVPIVMSH